MHLSASKKMNFLRGNTPLQKKDRKLLPNTLADLIDFKTNY